MPIDFKNRVVQYPKRFTIQADGADGTVNDPALEGKVVALLVAPGTVTEPGTPLDAEELNARDSFDKITDLTYVGAATGIFQGVITGYTLVDKDKLTLRFASTDIDQDVTVKVNVDTNVYNVKLKDTGNNVLVSEINGQIADIYFDGTDVIIDRVEPIEAEEQEYDLPIQSEQVIIPVEASPFEDERIDGGSIFNTVENSGKPFINTTGYVASNSVLSIASEKLLITGDGGNLVARATYNLKQLFISGLRLTVRVRARVTNAVCTAFEFNVDGSTGGAGQVKSIATPNQDQWYDIDDIVIDPGDWTGVAQIKISHIYADAATANGKVMEIEYVIMEAKATNEAWKLLTISDIAKRYNAPQSFGLHSVENPEIRIRNINLVNMLNDLLDRTGFAESVKIEDDKFVITAAVSGASSGVVIKVEPNTAYTLKAETLSGLTAANLVAYEFADEPSGDTYDTSLALATNSGSNPNTFTTNANTNYIIVGITSGGSVVIDSYAEKVQLELGSVATLYKVHDNSSKKYPNQTLGSVPNGVADYIDTVNNVLHELTKGYELLSGDMISLTISGTNVDFVTIDHTSFALPAKAGNGTIIDGKARIVGFDREVVVADRDLIASIGTHNYGSTTITLQVAKGTYGSLAAAQADLAGTIMRYELAEEIITEDIDVDGIAFAYKNMTIENIQDNGFGFSVFAKHDLNYEATAQSLGKALKTAMKEITINEDAIKDLEDGRRVLLFSGSLQANSGTIGSGVDIPLNEPLSNFEQFILKSRGTVEVRDLTAEWPDSVPEIFTLTEVDVSGTLNIKIYGFSLHRDDVNSKVIAFDSRRMEIAAVGNTALTATITHSNTEIWGVRKVVE